MGKLIHPSFNHGREAVFVLCPVNRHIYYCGEINKTLLIAVVREMPLFKKPVFTKKNPETGALQNCYRFDVEREEKDEHLQWMAEQKEDLSISAVVTQVHENLGWWYDLLRAFLQAHSSSFSKQYTVEQLHKVIKHEWLHTPTNEEQSFPFYLMIYPSQFQINGATFFAKWSYSTQPIAIDLPDIEKTSLDLPVLKNESIEEFDMEQIPMDQHSTDALLDASASARQMDRHRIKEARLKAKISLYKAQLQMRQYYDKYGEEYDDSDDDTDQDSSEEEEEVEEIQL